MTIPFWKHLERLTVTEQEKKKYYQDVEELLKNPLSIKPKNNDSFSSGGSGSFRFSDDSFEESHHKKSPSVSYSNLSTSSEEKYEEIGTVGGISWVMFRKKRGFEIGAIFDFFGIGKLYRNVPKRRCHL